jgi:hypothetical protein
MSRSTGRIRLAIQFMSRRENWFISSSPITLATLRSFLPWWGAAVASMFYILERRHSAWPMALCTTLIMAPSSLFRLQSGLALSDMFGMVFVLAFLLVEGASPPSPEGALARRIACGLIAGLSLGAQPHITLLILAYWCIRSVPSASGRRRLGLDRGACLCTGVAMWLIPVAWPPAASKPISRPRSANSNGGSGAQAFLCSARRSALVGCSLSRCCPSRQWSFQNPAADCRARLGQGKSSSRGPLFRFIAAACVVLLARGRDQLRAEDRRRLRSIPVHRRVRARGAVEQCQPLQA